MTKVDIELSIKSIFAALRDLESKGSSDGFMNKSAELLEEENSKLKERNLCLEKKINEMQSRMDRMKVHCQAIVSSDQGMKQMQDSLAEHIPKYMEDENAAMVEKITKLELEVFHISEEKQRCQEKMQQQQQKLDRLLELVKQMTSRVTNVEKQIAIVNDTCKRFAPATKALAQRCAALQRSQSHSRCLQEQADSSLAEERGRSDMLETQLVMANGRLLALQTESDSFRTLSNEQRNAILYYSKQIVQLEDKIQELKDKLTAAQELIRDQSELLSKKLRDQ